MKIVKKIKKVLIGIGTFFLTISTKVNGIEIPLYGMPNPEPVRSDLIKKIWNICRMFIIPIALLIGIIIYLKKSKSSKKKKILVILGIIALIALLYFFVNKIIY